MVKNLLWCYVCVIEYLWNDTYIVLFIFLFFSGPVAIGISLFHSTDAVLDLEVPGSTIFGSPIEDIIAAIISS